jgi:ATP-binding cassette subfamily F protein uup
LLNPREAQSAAAVTPDPGTTENSTPHKAAVPARKKLSYQLQRELDALPKTIEKLEQQQEELAARMAEPGFFASDPETVRKATEQLGVVEKELTAAFERWGELEGG